MTQLILTRVARDSCVATATAARRGGLQLQADADCMALSRPRNDRAPALMKASLQIDTRVPSQFGL